MNTDLVKRLKPCPFCEGEASADGVVRYSDNLVREDGLTQSEFYYCNCMSCGADNRGLRGYLTRDAAIAAWNRRPAALESPVAQPVPMALDGIKQAIDLLLEQTEEWRAFHKARGAAGYIEALACSIRIKALKDALRSITEPGR